MAISGHTQTVLAQILGSVNAAEQLVNLLNTGAHGAMTVSARQGLYQAICDPSAAGEIVAAITTGRATLSAFSKEKLAIATCDSAARSELVAAIQALT